MITIDIKIENLDPVKRIPAKIMKGAKKGVEETMPLIERRVKRRMGRPGEIGVVTGSLRRSIRYKVKQVGNTIVASIGSNLIYAATHEFGDPRRNIPARPYLRTSIADKQKLLNNKIKHHIAKEGNK